MKIVAGILAFIVLLLTVQPAFSFFEKGELVQCSSDCCADEAELPAQDQPDESSDPCSDFCNPFLKCGGCAASTVEFLAYNIQRPNQPGTKYISLTQRVHSQFAPDFWQPPKLA